MATQHSRSAARFMMAPAVFLLLVWMLVPLTMTLYFSFKKYLPLRGDSMANGLDWVGFANYTRFVGSSSFWPSIQATLITYETYWDRVTRQIEEGTWRRDLARLQRRKSVQPREATEETSESPVEATEQASSSPTPPSSPAPEKPTKTYPESVRKLHALIVGSAALEDGVELEYAERFQSWGLDLGWSIGFHRGAGWLVINCICCLS